MTPKKTLSEKSFIHINAIDNNSNISELKNKLKIENDINIIKKIENENHDISELYKNEEKFKFKDDIFEKQTMKVLAQKYKLEELDLFPYFKIGFSTKKNCKVSTLSYYKIECKLNDEKAYSYFFLNDRNEYMLSFNGIPMLFEKSEEGFVSVSIISKDYENYTDFQIKSIGELTWGIDFCLREINPELVDIRKKYIIYKNEVENNKDKENLDLDCKKKFEIIKKMYELINKKYSEDKIKEKKKFKREELALINEKIHYNNIMKVEINNEILIQQKGLIEKEIRELENLQSKISIKIKKIDKELDGFYLTSREIKLENSFKDLLIIPEKKAVIIEVKNHSNYYRILDNLRGKKNLIKELGLDEESFYFIGILRSLNIEQSKKREIEQKFRNFNFKNTIILYPEGLTFLGSPIEKHSVNNSFDLEKSINEINEKLNSLLDWKEEVNKILFSLGKS